MGVRKIAKMGKMAIFGEIGKNSKKNDKKNERVPDFLLEINATTLYPPHYAGKKMKKCPGEAHESAQTWEKPFFHFRPLSGMR